MAILYEKRGRVAYITINRPEARNAVDPETMQELSDAWIDFRDDDDLWIGVLTGAGDKSFSAGADLKSLIPRLTGALPGGAPGIQGGFGGLPRGFDCREEISDAVH